MKLPRVSGRSVLVTCIITILMVGLLTTLWISADYEPMPSAFTALLSDEEVIIHTEHDYVSFLPAKDNLHLDQKIGMLFYPGGKVDPLAYAPLIKGIAQQGVPSFIVRMPFQLAIFGGDRGRIVLDAHPEIDQWVIVGHSLGGVMACSFAQKNLDVIAGIALLAAYPAGGVDLSESGLHVVSLVGTLDSVIAINKIDETRGQLPANTRFIILEEGNHAQFGDYGDQRGDTPARMPRTVQQDLTVKAIVELFREIKL